MGAGLGRRRPGGGWIELVSQLGEVGGRMAQAADQALALSALESPGNLDAARRGAPGPTGDVLELVGQGFGGCARRRTLRFKAFEKEHRIGE